MKLIQLTGVVRKTHIDFQECELRIRQETEEEYTVQLDHKIPKSTMGKIRVFADAFRHFQPSYQVVIWNNEVEVFKEKIREQVIVDLQEETESLQKQIENLQKQIQTIQTNPFGTVREWKPKKKA